nr:unnamed protein product [Spirometra erinaceieuropaei]
MKNSSKRLEINPNTCEDPTQNRPAWEKAVKNGAVDHEINRIDDVKAKREARKSHVSLACKSANIPCVDRPHRSPPDSMRQQPDNSKRCVDARPSSNLYSVHDGDHPHHRLLAT